MKNIYEYHYDYLEFSKMLRNLSQKNDLNVKTLLNNFKNSNIENKQKIKVKKKIQQIRQNNLKKKQKLIIQEDLKKLEHYKNLQKLNKNIISDLKYFKTSYGAERLKYFFLKIAYESKDLDLVMELYLQLIHVEPETKKEKTVKRRVARLMEKINYKEYQFEFLSNRLPPLDFYNNYEKKLEDWQINILEHLEKNKDVIVCAKTSMGKTWLAMYPGLIEKRTLFIVPTKPLAYQVAATFTKLLKGRTSIITKNILFNDNKNIVVVGTPKEIEDNLYNKDINWNFDICVFDEIHNLNNYDGDSYERIIKLFSQKTQFLALSATIANKQKIQNWFESFTKRKVILIQHSIRFINLQRYKWDNNKLNLIHPLSCIEEEDINEEFLLDKLSLTPKDCITLYRSLKESFEEDIIKIYDINSVFTENNKRLNLEDSKKYELILKKGLIHLKQLYPKKIKEILDKFKENVTFEEETNLFNLFKTIKKQKKTPCIVFQSDPNNCQEIFIKITKYLEKLEYLNHPYHYTNLEWIHEFYTKYIEKKKLFEENIKLGKNDSRLTKQQKKKKMLENFDKKEINDFIKKYTDLIQNELKNIENSSVSEKIKRIQKKNLEKDLYEKTEILKIKDVDIFEKHKDFCLNSLQPMTADTIREIRRNIGKKIGVKIDYNNVFIQGLKRGIGIYTANMPEIYNQYVQLLSQNGELGFCISDRTLALGINMPFKTCCILEIKEIL